MAERERVAVVTGAGSGIGRAIARRCAANGMTVVIADVDQAALVLLAGEMAANGATTLAVPTDVSKLADVEALAQKALTAYGSIDILFSNARVQTYNNSWEASIEEWQWVLGVNVWGVIHCIKTFVPIMNAQGFGTIVNTASMGGLTSGSLGVYRASKHAVVALTEALHHELRQRNAPIRVVAFCPDVIATRIVDSERNRPDMVPDLTPESAAAQTRDRIRGAISKGATPETAADALFAGLQTDDFYIYTDPAAVERVRMRIDDILAGRAPRNPLLPRPPAS